MSGSVLRAGAIGGLLGGVVMAMWSMIVLAIIGEGFWTPVNLIAHTIWSGAPLDGAFSWGALLLGLAVHMMVSIGLGVAFAVAAQFAGRLAGSRTMVLGGGMVFGIAVWLVNQYLIWPALDSAASDAFTPWVFAIAHLMYGAVVGLLVAPALTATGHQVGRTAHA